MHFKRTLITSTLLCVTMFTLALAAPPEIPNNTWVDAGLTYIPPPDVPDATWQRGDGYCGTTFRTKTGTVLFRSGVVSKQRGWNPGFYSNATLEWAPASQEARVIEVANWGGGSYNAGVLLPEFEQHPTPTPRHTYEGMVYVESKDAMYFMLGANWRIAAKAEPRVKEVFEENNRVTWKYTFADKRWTAIPSHISQLGYKGSPYESHMKWWPERKRILFLDDVARFHAEFDPETERWTKLELAGRSPMSLFGARSAWDSRRQRWVFRHGAKACYFDPVTRTFTAMPDLFPAPEDKKDLLHKLKGIAYIPPYDVYIAVGLNGNDTQVFDIEKNVWSTIRGGDIAFPRGYLEYDAANDLLVLVYQHQAFRFRYKPD